MRTHIAWWRLPEQALFDGGVCLFRRFCFIFSAVACASGTKSAANEEPSPTGPYVAGLRRNQA